MPNIAKNRYGNYGFAKNASASPAQIARVADRKSKSQNAVNLNYGIYLTTGSQDWQNYTVKFDFFELNSCTPVFYLSLNIDASSKKYLRLGIDSFDGTITLERSDNGQFKQVASKAQTQIEFGDSTWKAFEIKSKNGTITVSINDVPLLEYKEADPSYAKGGVGFGSQETCGKATLFVDNVQIQAAK
jgi:Domain of Unknown Function (DUF1080)